MDEEFVEPAMTQENKIKKSGGFETFGLIPPVYHAVKKKGYNVPTPIQRRVINIFHSRLSHKFWLEGILLHAQRRDQVKQQHSSSP